MSDTKSLANQEESIYEAELKDMSIKGLSALFTQVIDPDQFRELLAPGSNLPKGLS
jgi:hypothetical protein